MGEMTTTIDSRKHYRITEDSLMPAIVEFPTVVKEALEEFGPAFANEPERRHFAEYLTGLMIANKKNVSAINREFAMTTDQSCLNRWITEVGWDEEAFNNQRLEWLQKSPDMTVLMWGTCRSIARSSSRVKNSKLKNWLGKSPPMIASPSC